MYIKLDQIYKIHKIDIIKWHKNYNKNQMKNLKNVMKLDKHLWI